MNSGSGFKPGVCAGMNHETGTGFGLGFLVAIELASPSATPYFATNLKSEMAISSFP